MGSSFEWKRGKEPTAKRAAWIRHWIKNERFLCFADAEYFITRYAKIRAVDESIIRFEFRIAQKIYLDILAEFDDVQLAIQIFVLKCLDPNTKVLTADLRWVPICSLKIGDELVSVDEDKPSGKGNCRKMRTCIVEKKWDTYGPAIRIRLDDGRSIVSGMEHPFLSRQRGGSDSQWREARDFCVGDEIRWITKPWGESDYEDGWFGGLADGEGSHNVNRMGSDFCITQRLNGVLDRARSYLKSRGYQFGEEVDVRTPEDSSVLGREPVGRLRLSRMDELFRLFGQTRPSRFLKSRFWEGKSLPGKKSGVGWSKVVSVEILPSQLLVDIQTSTGTFIAEGCVTHNCRQVGISTGTALFFLHRILFRANTHAIMASAQVGQSEKLGMIVDTAWERLPFWLPPAKTSLRTKEPKWENGSAMSVQAGSQTVGIAQGSSPSCIHLSELADYDNPVKTIEEGVFPAAHQTSSLFFVMEGTGDTASPWQRKKWQEYKETWGKGARFRPIFIPPCCAPDIYPHRDWLRGNPIKPNWNPAPETLRMKRRGELFVRSTDYLVKYFGSSWEMGLEYMWFWELGYQAAVKSHSEKTFLAQNAVCDTDAFQSKHDPVFSDEVIEVVTKDRKQNYKAYAITGKTIIVGQNYKPYWPPEHEIDYAAERIPLRWEANDGNVYTWELIPLKPFDDSTDEACFNKLLVFEEPRDGARYSEGIDCAQGLGLPQEDRSCCSVHRNEYGRDRDNQVAVFTSLNVNSAQMARIAACIATYYGTDGRGQITTADPMGVKFIIEQIRKAGDECVNQLQLMGFYNHHIMHFYDDKDSIRNPDRGKKLGWRTVEWSRDILINNFVNYVNMGWLKINDPIGIRQMKTFIRRKVGDDKAKMIHERGEHDDNLFAPAMANQTAHDQEDQSGRIERSYTPDHEDGPVSEEWATNEVEV